MKKLLALALFAIAFLPLLSDAQEKKGKSAGEQFKFFDKNNDGKVSKEEFLATTKDERKDKRGKNFDLADKDKDGLLTLEEWNATFAPR
jgi:Ca2+-binding EF-hand superfamily protein